ncbi:MAG: hypothetical protein WBA13_10155 [Microcoleaceae cyanobacterium]
MKTLIVKQHSNPAQFMKAPKPPKSDSQWGVQQTKIVSPQRISSKFIPAPPPRSTPIRLELEALNRFETVEHQFQLWGIAFKNAIALQPSNPAFITKAEQVVLMSGPSSGYIEINFRHPLRSIEARVISSQPAVLSAFNSEEQEIASTHTPVSESTGVISSVLPPTLLQIHTPEIHKVTFSTFDGQLIIDYLKVYF